jgi:hypothetical protein
MMDLGDLLATGFAVATAWREFCNTDHQYHAAREAQVDEG